MPIDDESEDNVSLVSRSPSPAPPESMDIDKYDEYVPGVAREEITVDTKIKSSNKGFAMLSKLGWVEGQPLGLSGDGTRASTTLFIPSHNSLLCYVRPR